jgi:hypothetical protein
MTDSDTATESRLLISMSYQKLLYIAIVGLITGAVIWGLALLLDTYVYKALLCANESAQQCLSSARYATTTATILGAAVGLFGLVRLQVFRPLLIVAAAIIALWGLLVVVSPLAWYVALPTVMALYGLAFAVFAWLTRVRHFLLALVSVIILIVIVRLVLNS